MTELLEYAIAQLKALPDEELRSRLVYWLKCKMSRPGKPSLTLQQIIKASRSRAI